MTIDDRLAPVLEVAASHASDVDDRGRYPEEAVAALRSSGLLGLTLPEEVGGLGAGPEDFSLVAGQLAGACGSTAMIYLMHVAAAMPLAAATPPGLDLLKGMASGELLGTLAFSEKGSRSHFWAPMSEASAKSDGSSAVQLTADKSWVTSAGHADVYVVSTRSVGAETPTTTDLYAVTAQHGGFEVSAPWLGMGLRGNASSPMRFDTTVDDGLRLGDSGSAFGTMMGVVLPWFNLGNASITLGLARTALEAAVGHVSGARLEHLGSNLADLPTIRARIGRAGTVLAANEEYVWAMARKIAGGSDDAMLYVLGARAAANDAALQVTDEAMRVCGGAAFSRHLPVERAFRDARAGHVMAPTSDVLYDFYAKSLCGMDLF
jgi:alkylation response protein AidB-like acyl-CoA dehydrogenase